MRGVESGLHMLYGTGQKHDSLGLFNKLGWGRRVRDNSSALHSTLQPAWIS